MRSTFDIGRLEKGIIGPSGPMGPKGEPGISPKELKDIKEYVGVIMKILGYDLSFDKFQNLTEAERKALIRDIKITMITKD